MCLGGVGGPAQSLKIEKGVWLSQDDVEDAYRQRGVGQSEGACLSRAQDYYDGCENNDASLPILARFIPSGNEAFYPLPGSPADVARNWEAIYALRRRLCTSLSHAPRIQQQRTNASFPGKSTQTHGEEEWIFNRLVGLKDFDLLRPEIEYLTDIGYCLNHDAMYKWAVIMRTISVLQQQGKIASKGLKSVDIGGGSAPLQYFMAERGDVVNIDINFMSSWFHTDSEGIYVRGIPHRLRAMRDRIVRAEGDLISQLAKLAAASVDVVYDACSLIHMWALYPSPQDGLAVAMEHILRCLKPGGYFVAVSDVAHPLGSEIREFVFAHTLASSFQANGQLEWESEPRFYMQEGEDEEHFSDYSTCVRIESAWHKPNTSSHTLSPASLHTCEVLPQGELRLLVANFVLRKPLDD